MSEINETSILDLLRDQVPKPEMPRWFLSRWSWVKVNERFVLALYPDQLIDKSFMNALFGSMNRDRARILKSDIKALRRVWRKLPHDERRVRAFIDDIWGDHDHDI